MTDEQRQKIINLRSAGNGYKKISKLLGLSENTVKVSANEESSAEWLLILVQKLQYVSVAENRYNRIPEGSRKSSAPTNAE